MEGQAPAGRKGIGREGLGPQTPSLIAIVSRDSPAAAAAVGESMLRKLMVERLYVDCAELDPSLGGLDSVGLA